LTFEEKDSRMKRGPHQSAQAHIEFLREEMLDFIKKGFWLLLPYSELRPLLNLIIHPIGVVPQRARRPRIIVDYTFYGFNADTVKLAPPEAMQFGKTLERLLHAIVEADPAFGPVHLIKVDIADGFYRVWLNISDIPKLAVAVPALDGEAPLLAIPLVLPMGWTESPPHFCSMTETVADVANDRARAGWVPPPHRLDSVAESIPEVEAPSPAPRTSLPTVPLPSTTPDTHHRSRPLAEFEVFVDDFIGLSQGPAPTRTAVRRVLFHTLDEVLRPLDELDDPCRQEPASVKKLRKGDAYWATRKEVLGWVLDCTQMTIELPSRRLLRLWEILDSVSLSQKRTSKKKWQQILGELRSMTIAIPGLKGMFSLLQHALSQLQGDRVRLNQGVHDTLEDLRWLAGDLTVRPTRLFEIVPQSRAEILTATDACGYGMGGVGFVASPSLQIRDTHPGDPSTNITPVLWRSRFPADVTSKLVSFKNPQGSITNSDLELGATIVHHDVLAQHYDIRERTISTGCDNTPAVSWQRKGSTTTTHAPAYLLRLQALHQRFHRYLPHIFYLPGPINKMADDASRLFHLSDADLLTHFNSHYPQTASWRMLHPSNEMLSSVTSALHRKRPEPASFLHAPLPTIVAGSCGQASALNCVSIPSFRKLTTQSFSCKFLDRDTDPASLPPVVGLSSLAQWKTPSVQWVRRSPEWGPLTLV
jgi:hypothetical protein